MKQSIARNVPWLAPLSVIVLAYGVATVIRNGESTVEVITSES